MKINLIKITPEDIPQYLEMGIKNAPCVIYGTQTKPFVWIGKEELCDFDYIQKNNIPYKRLNGPGSTVVCSEGDINFGFFGTKQFCEEMFDKLSIFVSKKINGYTFLNNDFMYNGNKHGSFTRIDFDNIHYIGVHISNNINKELIEIICKKKCYKQPEKLPDPITEEDVLKIYGENNGNML